MASMVKCKACGVDISKNAKVCPQCGEPAPKKTSLATWLFLGFIVLIGIGMSNNSSSGSSSAPLTPKEEAKTQVKLENFEWGTSGFGSVMMADFKIKNDSKYLIKDIEITCTHTAKSGTVIDSNKRVIYDSVEAGKTKKIKNFNMGFINSQVNQSSCEITDFQI